MNYQLGKANEAPNSTYVLPNIYLRDLDVLVKLDLRYAQALTMLDGRHELADQILSDTRKLLGRVVHLNPQLRFQCFFLIGYAKKQIFLEKVRAYQQEYVERYRGGHAKYRYFFEHVPDEGIAPGEFL